MLNKASMRAGYRVITPIAHACMVLGIPANAVTLASLGLAAIAAALFAFGDFGLGAVVGAAAAMADAVDGLVARETLTASRLGQVLDTTVDRYVEALLFGGIALHVRHDGWLLALVLLALVGAFMVSYASSVLRELGAQSAGGAMRRAERMVYLLGGAAIVPLASWLKPEAGSHAHLATLLLALGAIGVIGNASAVSRIVSAGSALSPARREARTARDGAHAERTSHASHAGHQRSPSPDEARVLTDEATPVEAPARGRLLG
jgi:CDP-diacylglycerol--glycerol-3-phosphate 3-phosphatidyltransferase